VPYVHVVFTLPHALLPLTYRNSVRLFTWLFQTSAATLREVAVDPRHLGAEIGVLSILHTWGQTLVRHPHVHCVVPAGGLSPDHQRWIHPTYAGFFLPVKVLSRVFRGTFVEALRRAYDRRELDLAGASEHLRDRAAWRAFDEGSTHMKSRHTNHGLRKLCKHNRRQPAKCPCSWFMNYRPRNPARRNPKTKDGSYRFGLDRLLHRHIADKTTAEREAFRLKEAIDAGTFGRPAPVQDMTLRQLADTYRERYVKVDHPATVNEFTYELNTICRTVVPCPTGGSAPLGDWPLTNITTDSVEHFREIRIKQGTGRVGVNRNVRRLRALFRWALKKQYATSTPFKINGETVISLDKEQPRSRRLNPPEYPDEEAKLLAAAGPHLRALIEAALDTGCRSGELLSLTWAQVEGLTLGDDGKTIRWTPKPRLFLPKEKTKTKADRWVPISTRLRSLLEMRRFDPAGQPLPMDRYVFGTEIGTRVLSFKRAWNTAVLKSHGHTPTFTRKKIDEHTTVKTANLSTEARAALRKINLHFHDLRRECGSRWLQGGVPLFKIRDWLGHTNIAQTSTYLAGTGTDDHADLARFEAHQTRLQQMATDVDTGGQKRPRTAMRRSKKTKKDMVGHDQAIM
jgi:integrase